MKFLKKLKLHTLTLGGALLLYALVYLVSVVCALGNGSAILSDFLGRNLLEQSVKDYGIMDQKQYRTIDCKVTYLLDGEIPSTQVVFGKNNWLFYKGEEQSIPDFEGTNSYSNKEMEQMLQATLSVQNSLLNRGIQFALLVPPNKERVYFEFMPENYKHTEVSRTDILMNYLHKNGVNAVSPKDSLMKAKKDYQIYYSSDSHWNKLGAYIGTQCVLNSWGIETPNLEYRTITKTPLSAGDLADMVGIKSSDCNDMEYSISKDDSGLQDSLTDWEGLQCIQNELAKSNKVLLIVGDSFRTAMIPTLTEYFQTVYAVHRDQYRAKILDEILPDYVIVEYVERYSDRVMNIERIILENVE